MKLVQKLSRAACVLAVCGMLIPGGAMAAQPTPKAAPMRDVALSANGTLTGQVLNPEGLPLDGAVVSIRQGEKEITQAVANKSGVFEVSGLSNGVYDVAVGPHVGSFRAWSAQVAPPTATQQAVMVVGTPTRGQYGTALSGIDFISLTTLGAAITAAILAGIALGKINDIDTCCSP